MPEYSADRKDGEYREAGIFYYRCRELLVVSWCFLLIGYIFQFVEGYSGGGFFPGFNINLPGDHSDACGHASGPGALIFNH